MLHGDPAVHVGRADGRKPRRKDGGGGEGGGEQAGEGEGGEQGVEGDGEGDLTARAGAISWACSARAGTWMATQIAATGFINGTAPPTRSPCRG